MKSTSAINIHVNKELKDEATTIINDLGMSMSTAINIFLTQVVKHEGIPFLVREPKPTRQLKRAIKEADKIAAGKKKTKSYNNIEELFKDLNAG